MKIIMLGAPGAGKGTQAAVVSRELGIPTISTGNILREAMKNGTPVGLKAKAFMESGKLVPDTVIIDIVKERLSQDDCVQGYILDGMPRTIAQAEALEEAGIRFDAVVLMETEDADIEKRMSGRRVCPACGASFHTEANPPKEEGVCDECGEKLIIRDDDKPETVRARLAVYHEQTEPLIEFYRAREILKPVCGTDGVDEISASILSILRSCK
ncbi:MAG: adenylate kinase [Oscillospiraceae bacterium]|nr:adenylate kinase [Oscillospiraceae bacterium]